MRRENLSQRDAFAMIGTLMIIVGLIFLMYIGSSLLHSTKRYQDAKTEMAHR